MCTLWIWIWLIVSLRDCSIALILSILSTFSGSLQSLKNKTNRLAVTLLSIFFLVCPLFLWQANQCHRFTTGRTFNRIMCHERKITATLSGKISKEICIPTAFIYQYSSLCWICYELLLFTWHAFEAPPPDPATRQALLIAPVKLLKSK